MKSHYANINHIRMHYVSAGQGQLMIFLHGFPEFWYQWKNQLLTLSQTYLTVAPDMRGYNLSEKPADLNAYEIHTLVEDIRALIAFLGFKQCILVGNDWGGLVAWSFAMLYPTYCTRLIIINAPHPIIFENLLATNVKQQLASQYLLLFRSAQAEKILSENNFDQLFNHVLREITEQNLLTEEDKQQYLKAWSQPGALHASLQYYRVKHHWPNHVLSMPVLMIRGEKDKLLIAENWHGLDQYASNYQIQTIQDGSHWVTHEKPAIINTLINAFLST